MEDDLNEFLKYLNEFKEQIELNESQDNVYRINSLINIT